MGFLYRLFGIAHLSLHVRRSQQQLCHFRHVFDGWYTHGALFRGRANELARQMCNFRRRMKIVYALLWHRFFICFFRLTLF
jgi:hypothetical protein